MKVIGGFTVVAILAVICGTFGVYLYTQGMTGLVVMVDQLHSLMIRRSVATKLMRVGATPVSSAMRSISSRTRL